MSQRALTASPVGDPPPRHCPSPIQTSKASVQARSHHQVLLQEKQEEKLFQSRFAGSPPFFLSFFSLSFSRLLRHAWTVRRASQSNREQHSLFLCQSAEQMTEKWARLPLMIVEVCRCQFCPLDKHCERMFRDLRVFFSFCFFLFFLVSPLVSNEQLNLSKVPTATLEIPKKCQRA